MKIKIVVISLVLLSLSQLTSAQRSGYNLSKFDKKFYHFGFLLSINRSDFALTNQVDVHFADSLLGIANKPQGGFDLALLASLDMTPNLHLRFVPGLSWQDRGLNYRFLESDDGEIKEKVYLKRTESVYLEFPLLLKVRTNRVGNFAAYGLIGGKFGLDMQSQNDVNNATSSVKIVKLQKSDYSIVAGAGVDFFLPYFKFGIEMKTALGMPNVLIPEDHKFSSTIDQLRTRTFVLSFTFEG